MKEEIDTDRTAGAVEIGMGTIIESDRSSRVEVMMEDPENTATIVVVIVVPIAVSVSATKKINIMSHRIGNVRR